MSGPHRKSIYPIPQPQQIASVIYEASHSPKGSTLQEQMGFGGDDEDFNSLMRIIRETAACNIDVTLAYKWQDPELINLIKEEVLAQCPTLGEMYVDAWPINSYLRLALKTHKQGESVEKKLAAKLAHSVRKAVQRMPKSRGTSAGPRERKSASRDLSSLRSVRRSIRVRKLERKGGASHSGKQKKVGAKDKTDEDELDVQMESSGSEKRGESEYRASPIILISDSEEEVETLSSATRHSIAAITSDSNTASDTESQTAVMEHSHQSISLNPLRSIHYAPRKVHMPVTVRSSPSDSDASPPDVETIEDDAVPVATTREKTPAPPASVPAATTGTTPASDPSATIQGMLVTRGLPPADAKSIADLFASMGIVNKTYLLVFARLSPRAREARLSEMIQKGQLTHIQALVLVDMLDAVAAESR